MVKYLPDMCDNLDSQRIPITGSDRKTGSIPYYGASGVVDYVEKYIFDEELLLVSEDGANLVMRNSPIAFSVSGKTWVNNHAHVLRFSDQWLRQYVELYLNSISLEPYITGTAQPKLNQQMLNNIPIPVPDESQIRYIVTCTTCVHKLISLRKQQIAKLDELVKARFVEMFGDPVSNPLKWKRQRLDSLCENLDSRRIPITSSERKAGIYPYYGASGIVDYVEGYIFDEDILLISEDGANLVMRTTPIAFSVTGKVWVNNHAHVVRFDSMATQKYIEVYFSLIDISGSITGTAQPKLNQEKLNAMMFCVPPLNLQNQFAAFVAQTDKQKLTIQQSLDKLELMKKALMQKYFG